MSYACFFFNDTATTEIYTLSLHDALPILRRLLSAGNLRRRQHPERAVLRVGWRGLQRVRGGHLLQRRRLRELGSRSEEHTSELQSRQYLVCRLLLEKKKKKKMQHTYILID